MLRGVHLSLIFLVSASTVACAEPSFRNDVMAVLSKAGCNAGSCHGNANGKGGFKLSLRGEDAERDFLVLTREMFGRRINMSEAAQSLLLLKPSTQLAHEGGSRFATSSAEYEILRDWIASGARNDLETAPKLRGIQIAPSDRTLIAPTNQLQLSISATFDDGSTRDVTALTVYEPTDLMAKVGSNGLVTVTRGEATVLVRYLDQQQPVRVTFIPPRTNFVWRPVPANNFIDEHIFSKLERLRVQPAEVCGDSDFVRRAHLDLLGVIPSAEEARHFVEDSRRDKRSRLVERLLQKPEFADFWALKWADLLRNEEKVLDRKGVQTFQRWIRDSIATNKPLDRFAREILSARGSSYQVPQANFLRAVRDPVKRAEATAQVFLGTRLLCAQCHNHPYDRWTQSDYYNWAAVFAPVSYKVIENNRRDKLDTHEFNGEQIIYASYRPTVTNPRTGKRAKAAYLGENGGDSHSDALAEWVAHNRQFARAQVNRVWSHLMGRGLVDPIDDFRLTNPASHPELLDRLTQDFVEHDFALRYLVRLIMSSRAYQLSSEPNDTNVDDNMNYSHVIPRRLSAEQLVDSQHEAAQAPTRFSGYPPGMKATQIPGVIVAPSGRRGGSLSADDQMLKVFGKPQRLLTCECERSNETTMSQAFQLIGGPSVDELLRQDGNRLSKLSGNGKPKREMIAELYWAALSRGPSDKELTAGLSHLATTKNVRPGLEDLAWALLNAKEFILRK